MSLLFGNLTQAFVEFTMTINAVQQGTASPADLEASASSFRRTAAEDASYLVYLGRQR